MSSDDVLKFPPKPRTESVVTEKLNFFTTSRGRLFSHRFMGAVSLGVGVAIYSAQTVFIDYYLDFVRAYR